MPRIDENIKRDIVDQLYWDSRVNAADIKVAVLDGVVTLSGFVNTSNARYSAASDTWMIEGVTDVNNDLRVIYEAEMNLPTDMQIKSQAENTLLWNEDIDSTKTEVSVSEGIVTLTGTVDSLWKKWEAEQTVYRNFGVISVENHLTIVPTTSIVDQDIAEDIEKAMDRNYYIDAEDISVKVDRGIVTLMGDVTTTIARTQAEDIALYTAGVMNVKNELRLATPVAV
ncbi:MAG: BON domain-containing protein [Anaerolineales bacterium]|jgi:osmotically-inducible protein OsmY